MLVVPSLLLLVPISNRARGVMQYSQSIWVVGPNPLSKPLEYFPPFKSQTHIPLDTCNSTSAPTYLDTYPVSRPQGGSIMRTDHMPPRRTHQIESSTESSKDPVAINTPCPRQSLKSAEAEDVSDKRPFTHTRQYPRTYTQSPCSKPAGLYHHQRLDRGSREASMSEELFPCRSLRGPSQ